MDIRQYLEENKLTLGWVAHHVQYSLGHIQQIVAGTRRPGKRLIRDIKKLTNGMVMTADDICSPRKKKEKVGCVESDVKNSSDQV